MQRLPLPAFPIAQTGNERYFERLSAERKDEPGEQSTLLKTIRAAFRGSASDTGSSFRSFLSNPIDDPTCGEEELGWNDHTVTFSVGGILKARWNFELEGQNIQYACIATLHHSGVPSTPGMPMKADGKSLKEAEKKASESDAQETFSPFFRTPNRRDADQPSFSQGVFVFLRSFGKICLLNGMDYTFSLPFIVRKAWRLHPHGVLLQRELDESEIKGLEDDSGECPLPTLFTMTNPYEEPRAVGVRERIKGGFETEEAIFESSPLDDATVEFIPPGEQVMWVSERAPGAVLDILATISSDRRRLSLWHYAHEEAKSVPSANTNRQAHSRTAGKKAAANPIPSGSTGTTQSTAAQEMAARGDRIREPSLEDFEATQPVEYGDTPLAALPGMPPALSAAATMASIASGHSSNVPPPTTSPPFLGRRSSFTRNDLSSTMDRMVLGRASDVGLLPDTITQDTVHPTYWVKKLIYWELPESETPVWNRITISLYGYVRNRDTCDSFLTLCIPNAPSQHFSISVQADRTLMMEHQGPGGCLSAVPILGTRLDVLDLLRINSEHQLEIVTYSGLIVPLDVKADDLRARLWNDNEDLSMAEAEEDVTMTSTAGRADFPVALVDAIQSSATVVYESGSRYRINANLLPSDKLAYDILEKLAINIPPKQFVVIHKRFLRFWCESGWSSQPDEQFDCIYRGMSSLIECLSVTDTIENVQLSPFERMMHSHSATRLKDDPALHNLEAPRKALPRFKATIAQVSKQDKINLLACLYPMHYLAEEMRLYLPSHERLSRLATLIIRLARYSAPGWADYWKRLFPGAGEGWRQTDIQFFFESDDKEWPYDLSAALFARLANPGDVGNNMGKIIADATTPQKLGFVNRKPFPLLRNITKLLDTLCNASEPDSRKRAESCVKEMVWMGFSPDYLSMLTHAIQAPLREAARTCQMSPPTAWTINGYEFIGRNDIAETIIIGEVPFSDEGYRSVKEHTNPKRLRRSYRSVFDEAHRAVHHGDDNLLGIELDLNVFTEIRYGIDQRIREVARMLRSSVTPTIRMQERPDLSEHDLAKEQQAQAIRTAERTLSLPLGRAIFTFGSVTTVKKEVFVTPRIELSVRITPLNIVIAPEAGKIPQESFHWAEFHNGVAAALRIAPSSSSIDSSWIAFNKPNDLTAEHAGFLYGLGLTGHLKEMLTWHTFGYLTPKHDMTSIGVLLGLAAAHVGTGDRHVTKLLAVHTPAFLPTEGVNLNVPLQTQAAGLVGIGLLYMATKNRRMAEVALTQIYRSDLMHPDVSNEHRESYVLAAALSFGMVMLARGTTTSSPADVSLLSRLRLLIHGEGPSSKRSRDMPYFDVNLTSPAATLALGLMFLKSNRSDIADILTIPDTVLTLNSVQPSFLLIRTLSRALILWDSVSATKEWFQSQIPTSITKAVEGRNQGKMIDDAMELAYYNIVAGCCFALGLKFAGTAREDAYSRIIEFHDFFNRSIHQNNPAYDHKIKKAAIRDGLGMCALALNMVMAGTGEINCLRRLRYAHGMSAVPTKYGSHVATHMSLGLLFMGGGRYTLGSSNASIASMVAAFYPRFPPVSSDNKAYLQALRHLWVLAAEPRCLIVRDVDTKEVLYLPMKMRFKDNADQSVWAQLITPTLMPTLDRLQSIKVDTPRYWPFLLDIGGDPGHREAILRNQTIFVKRRTMFLSYLEDPKGSRSLFVRSGLATGEAASLDHPQLLDSNAHPASDLHQLITSHSNDETFVSFADRLCRKDSATIDKERCFIAYCHAVLLDCIVHDKPHMLPSYLHLYRIRTMRPTSRYFQNTQQDLYRLSEFYLRLFERRHSGRSSAPDNTGAGGSLPRPALLRESAIASVDRELAGRLAQSYNSSDMLNAIHAYVEDRCSEPVLQNPPPTFPELDYYLSWYLSRHAVPYAAYLYNLRALALEQFHKFSLLNNHDPTAFLNSVGEEIEIDHMNLAEEGLTHVIHQSVMSLTRPSMYWTMESFNHVLNIWRNRHMLP